MRLVGSKYFNEGRVEVLYNGEWGTVCDDNFDQVDADVICKYLGYPGVETPYQQMDFGPGSGPVLMSNMQCSGTEHGPYQCTQDIIGSNTCGHDRDMGIRCQSK